MRSFLPLLQCGNKNGIVENYITGNSGTNNMEFHVDKDSERFLENF
jgi:hypothetical protein